MCRHLEHNTEFSFRTSGYPELLSGKGSYFSELQLTLGSKH